MGMIVFRAVEMRGPAIQEHTATRNRAKACASGCRPRLSTGQPGSGYMNRRFTTHNCSVPVGRTSQRVGKDLGERELDFLGCTLTRTTGLDRESSILLIGVPTKNPTKPSFQLTRSVPTNRCPLSSTFTVSIPTG